VLFISYLAPFNRLEINFKADIQSTLKRTLLAQSSLDDFVFEPGNLFQGGCWNGARYKIHLNFTINSEFAILSGIKNDKKCKLLPT